MFKNPFALTGRIRRLEYGLSYVMYIIFMLATAMLAELFSSIDQLLGMFLVTCAYIPAIWFLIAQGAKRCHDRDNSGAWQFIPFYGFWMLFADGDIGINEYGANPKGL